MGDLLIHFCVMARGSLSETVNHLMDTLHEGYIIEETFTDIKKRGKGIERMLNGYLTFLHKKRDESK
jgi:four helix bundle protein